MKCFKLTLIAASIAVLVSPFAVQAATEFDNFTAIPSSVAAGSLPEATPLLLGNGSWTHKTIDANDPVGSPNRRGDNWDMIASNESGVDRGRYIYSPYEDFGTASPTGGGVKRYDTQTGASISIVAVGTQDFVAGDASRWTPWGSYLTAEESWGAGSTKGRLFELTNPVTATSSTDANFVHRDLLPRVSHEGLSFDSNNNLYFIDELNGGSIYKFTSANPLATNGNDFFSAGQTFALKVGAGSNSDASGLFTWEAITNSSGAALGSTSSAVLTNGALDGRAAADLVGATNYQRPEDMDVKKLANGDEVLIVATTTTNDVWTINLDSGNIGRLLDRNTIKEGTTVGVGTELTSPDNIAIDAEGNVYVIEDQPGGSADIWFVKDADNNGVAESMGRWATMSTAGAEPTGLYFNVTDPNVAYVNIQHANSDIDRLIEIRTPAAVPVPGAVWLFGSALLGLIGKVRRKAQI